MVRDKHNAVVEQALDILEDSDFDLSKMFEEDGLLKHLTKRLVERALQAELGHHPVFKSQVQLVDKIQIPIRVP